ncbi:MAG: NUDIX hydrolase [Bacteroidota bacterium]
MSYLLELREIVGHRPLLMVGATVLVLDTEGRLLLLKRADNACWGPPGGAVEPGEAVEAAALRETLEETGLELPEVSLFGVFSGEDQFYCYPNGDEVHIVNIVYECRGPNRDVQLSREHTASGWFGPGELPEPISPPIIPVLSKLIENLKERGHWQDGIESGPAGW